METLVNITNYEDYKCALKRELQATAEGFVRIGYLLKQARDTDILKTSGYENVNEFAQREFGLEKSQVSRFISINERFADPEYPDQLMDNYKGYGVAKLSLMLQLPDEINEEFTPEYSKSEIQAVKDEYDAEKEITDLEVLMEDQEGQQEEENQPIDDAIYQIGKNNTELYIEFHKAVNFKQMREKDWFELFAPSGERIYTLRVPRVGGMVLSFKGENEKPVLTNMRSNEKYEYSWERVIQAIQKIVPDIEEGTKAWEDIYQEPFPIKEKQEIAPVQQKKQTKVVKTAPKKEKKPQVPKMEESTLHKVNPEIPEPDPIEPEIEENGSIESNGQQCEATEEQLPGQDSVENHEEWMPKPIEPSVDTTDSSENVEKTQCEEISEEEIATLKLKITTAVSTLRYRVLDNKWDEAAGVAEDIQTMCEQIMGMF